MRVPWIAISYRMNGPQRAACFIQGKPIAKMDCTINRTHCVTSSFKAAFLNLKTASYTMLQCMYVACYDREILDTTQTDGLTDGQTIRSSSFHQAVNSLCETITISGMMFMGMFDTRQKLCPDNHNTQQAIPIND